MQGSLHKNQHAVRKPLLPEPWRRNGIQVRRKQGREMLSDRRKSRCDDLGEEQSEGAREKTWVHLENKSVQLSSVAQSCPTLCDPMNRSTPGLPVHHQLLEFTQTNVHWVGDAIQPSHPLSSPSPPAPKPSQHQRLFQWVNSSRGGQSTGVSALASFLPKKSQGWSPSGWTGWISLQSKGLSRVFSNTTVKSINSSVLSLLYNPTHIHTWPQEKP